MRTITELCSYIIRETKHRTMARVIVVLPKKYQELLMTRAVNKYLTLRDSKDRWKSFTQLSWFVTYTDALNISSMNKLKEYSDKRKKK